MTLAAAGAVVRGWGGVARLREAHLQRDVLKPKLPPDVPQQVQRARIGRRGAIDAQSRAGAAAKSGYSAAISPSSAKER